MKNIISRMINVLEPSLFSVDANKQKDYINRLGEAKDDFERSYYQYKCQMSLKNKAVRVIYNCLSMIILISLRFKSWDKLEHINKDENALFLFSGNANIIPNEVVTKYGTPIQIVNWQTKHYLSNLDKDFIRTNLNRYRFSFYFLLKSILKITIYSYWIEAYLPRCLIVASEYSFTSSLLTSYCNFRGIKHINVMHGEKMYYIRDSYFHFDTCYIWDSYYKNLFCDMYAESSQFVIAIPDKLIPKSSNLVENKYVDYTYYLGGENKQQIKRLIITMYNLKKDNLRIVLRPHPIYTSIKVIKKYFKDFEIEKTNEISIEDSLSRTKYAISIYSTVLQEAVLYGTKIVIDDVTNPLQYAQLRELRYKLLDDKHIKLSDIMKLY